MTRKTEQDFAGEFAEARALVHAAEVLRKQADKLIRKQTRRRVARWEKQGRYDEIRRLAILLPDSIEKFYMHSAAERSLANSVKKMA